MVIVILWGENMCISFPFVYFIAKELYKRKVLFVQWLICVCLCLCVYLCVSMSWRKTFECLDMFMSPAQPTCTLLVVPVPISGLPWHIRLILTVTQGCWSRGVHTLPDCTEKQNGNSSSHVIYYKLIVMWSLKLFKNWWFVLLSGLGKKTVCFA